VQNIQQGRRLPDHNTGEKGSAEAHIGLDFPQGRIGSKPKYDDTYIVA
jgi:hypothetical protein